MSKGKQNQIPNFIQKLIQILGDKSCKNIIRWTQDQNSFIIINIGQFTQHVLSKYFKHQNYSSFIRQLNMYGFNKIRHQQGDNVYINQNFKRGQKSLIKNIKRKLALQKEQKEDKIMLYSNYNNSFIQQVSELKEKQKDLEIMCYQLVKQNRKLLNQNNLLIKKMRQQYQQKDNWLEKIFIRLIMTKKNNQIESNNFINPNQLSLTGNVNQQFKKFNQNHIKDFADNQGEWHLSKMLQQDQNMKNLHNIINYMYKNNNKKKIKRKKESTQQNRILDESISEYINKQYPNEIQDNSPINLKLQQNQLDKNESILSINQFLNIQDIDFKNKQTEL